LRKHRPTPTAHIPDAPAALARPAFASVPPCRPLGQLSPPVAPDPDLPPELVNHPKFQVLRRLGQGGMGTVYHARHKVMDRDVALKVINPAFLEHPDALPRFFAEVKAAARLDHPNIVRAYDAEPAGSLQLFVMEYVEGINLADYLARKGPLSVEHACRFVLQAAAGLQHAHEQGMVHRDIKPANLMLTRKGQIKILDFGLARLASERRQGTGLTQSNAFLGTPEYVAPEQALDARQADIRADLYSLGCTLFYLLAGRSPFQADTVMKMVLSHIENEAPSLHQLRPDVPAGLAAVVARLLAKDPKQRYQLPIEVVRALAPFARKEGGASVVTGPVSPAQSATAALPVAVPAAERASTFADLDAGKPSPRASRRRSGQGPAGTGFPRAALRRRWPLLVGVAVGVVLLVIGVWLLMGRSPPGKAGDGVVVLQVNEEGADVFVDGDKVTVTGKANEPVDIRLKKGRHKLEVRKGAFSAVSREVVLAENGRKVVDIMLDALRMANSIGMEFVFIKPGTFQMGSPETEHMHDRDEKQHQVTLTKGFYLQTTLVTQQQWQAVMGVNSNPSNFKGDDLPVDTVSWDDAKEFCRKRSTTESRAYRLPYEAEWEYAARAGTTTPFWQGATITTDQVNFDGKSPYRDTDPKGEYRGRTTPVKQFKANAWGLYDMGGNLFQWCEDCYAEYPDGPIEDSKGSNTGTWRVLRGGGWGSFAGHCRAAYRYRVEPTFRPYNVGFRVVFRLD